MDKCDFELSVKQRDGYLAAILREDLTVGMLEKSDYRVCSDYFVDGEPAKLYMISNPNWLPTDHEHNIMKQKQVRLWIVQDMSKLKKSTDEQKAREENVLQIDEIVMSEIEKS